MGRICSISMTPLSTHVILVIISILAYVELTQSCHRRVEYHQYYKKQPHKGHGHGGGHGGGHGHGGGYGHGGGGYGHQGGYGHKGGGHAHHGKGGGHGGGHSGYGKGGHAAYGHGGGHTGYGKGGHSAYGHGGGMPSYGHGGGHSMYGHGGGHSMYGHGGGHSMYGHGQDHGKGYGHGGGEGYGQEHGGGYGQEHGGEGYGHQGGHGGHDGGHEHGEYGGTGGHGYGHDDGYGTGGGYGDSGHGGHGKGHQNQGQKGRRYKYQMYEAMHYNDKGGGHGHQPAPAHGYSQNTPHYTQKGYGYSGPYPNTEYSSPVATSLDVPTGISYANIPNSNAGTGIDNGRPPPPSSQLDAADTADLIRNAYDTRENEVAVTDHGLGNYRGSVGGSVDAVPETMTDPLAVGNFDLNVNYNSELPTPFRRNSNQLQDRERRKKKISSIYRDNDDRVSSLVIPGDDVDDDADASQSKQVPSGPDYLENDAGDVVGANSPGPPDSIMNF